MYSTTDGEAEMIAKANRLCLPEASALHVMHIAAVKFKSEHFGNRSDSGRGHVAQHQQLGMMSVTLAQTLTALGCCASTMQVAHLPCKLHSAHMERSASIAKQLDFATPCRQPTTHLWAHRCRDRP